MASKEVRVGTIPDHLLEHFQQYLTRLHNETDDLSKPQLRRSIVNVYPLIIVLYAAIVLIGTASNVAVIAVIVRRRLYRDPTYFFVINLALSDIVKCVVVLPATLAVLLIQNWIFGSFMCHFIPMMQDIPIHASMLTHVTIAIDRYRLIAYSSSIVSSRLPRSLCAFSVWMLAGCVTLPYVFYVRYFDFGTIVGPKVAGVFLCTVNMEDDIEEYMRGMFICLYVLPLTIIAFLYVRIDGEFKVRDSPLATTTTALFEMSSTDERSTATSESTPCPGRSSWAGCTLPVPAALPLPMAPSAADADDDEGTYRPSRSRRCRRQTDFYEDELDVRKERRTQKYLIGMVTLFAMCLCPLKILGLGKHVTVDTSDNSSHFDIAFITFVWISFLSTCTTPVLFASWRMSRSSKDRLLAYFRLNSRRDDRHSTTAAFVTAVDNKRAANGRGRNNDGYTHTPSSSTGTSNRLTVVTGNLRRKSDERTAPQDDRRSTGPNRSKSLI